MGPAQMPIGLGKTCRADGIDNPSLLECAVVAGTAVETARHSERLPPIVQMC